MVKSDLAKKSRSELRPVEAHADVGIKVPPVVGDFFAVHSLAIHGEVEAAAAGAVGVVEFEAGLVEPDLEHAGLEGDFRPPPARISDRLRRAAAAALLLNCELGMVLSLLPSKK